MPDLDTLLASSMTALLNNSETRAAIVDYIQTLTNKNKPTEQWREVWYQQTSYMRTDPREDRNTLLKNRKQRLLVVALWHAETRSGKILALLSGEYEYSQYKHFNGMWGYLDRDISNQIDSRSAIYQDYPDLIIAAQQYWSEALTIYHEKTEPLPEESK